MTFRAPPCSKGMFTFNALSVVTPEIYRSHKCIGQKLQRKEELSINRRDL